ncbi:MAG: metal-dependent hydrolase [Desulfurococcales archaeon]|nr:metal-dependent hydrolase [Desulfurococcales archaeon]
MGRITYYGHAAFRLELDGKNILIDPWLDNPLSPVKPNDVRDIDIVIITHAHGDHVGNAEQILRNNPNSKLVAIYELASDVGSKAGIDQSRIIGGNIGGPMRVDGIEIALTPATHSSQGIGNPTGVIVRGREGTVYHAGDTGVMMDMKLIREIYKPHIALLPIGGHFTMDPIEAAKAVELLNPRVAIPMHYATFPVLYGKPEDFKKLVESKCLPTDVVILKPGESYEFDFSK